MVIKKITLSGNSIRFLLVFLVIACNLSITNLQAQHFYFVQITDTHFDSGDNLKRTEMAVQKINALPMEIKCVVHTGDISSIKPENKIAFDAGVALLDKIKVPIHFVPGNHDINIKDPDISIKNYKEKFGDLIQHVEYDSVVFILVYTEPLRYGLSLTDFDPLKQLEEILVKANGKPVLIFNHAPSVDDFYDNELHEGWDAEMQKKWIALINNYNVKAVFAGHFHRDEHHWLGKVPLYISSSISGYWNRQATFRIYEYNNGKISYRTQYLN